MNIIINKLSPMFKIYIYSIAISDFPPAISDSETEEEKEESVSINIISEIDEQIKNINIT